MVEPEAFLDDQERLLREGEQIEDDIFRGASPSQAVFWCCGSLGAAMRVLPGNVVAVDRSLDWDQALAARLDPSAPWYRKYMDFADALVRRAAGRFPVSHGTLVGPLDLAVSLRGHEQTVIDLMEEPDKAARVLGNMADFFVAITATSGNGCRSFTAAGTTPSTSSGPRARSPACRKTPSPCSRRGSTATMSGRSTSGSPPLSSAPLCTCMRPRCSSSTRSSRSSALRCLEINNDVGGPPVKEMAPHFARVQRAGRSLLIRGSFSPDELRLLMDSLEPRGLYLYVMVSDRNEIDRLRPIVGM